MKSDFATRLRVKRADMGLYQKEMADMLGHSVRTQEGYERGWKVPGMARIAEIADTLHVPVSWMIGEGATFAYDCTTADYIKVVNAGFQALADKIMALETEIADLKEGKE